MKDENFVMLTLLILFASGVIMLYQHMDIKIILQKQDGITSQLTELIKELNDYETSN